MSKKKREKQYLDIQISNPENMVWIGRAESVSSKNSQGEFDILPNHAQFITIVMDYPIVINTGEESKTFSYKSAVIYTADNSVKIYVNV